MVLRRLSFVGVHSLTALALTQISPRHPRHPTLSPKDVYHTYLSLAALSLSITPSPSRSSALPTSSISLPLRTLDPAWNVSLAVAERMRTTLAALPKLELDG